MYQIGQALTILLALSRAAWYNVARNLNWNDSNSMRKTRIAFTGASKPLLRKTVVLKTHWNVNGNSVQLVSTSITIKDKLHLSTEVSMQMGHKTPPNWYLNHWVHNLFYLAGLHVFILFNEILKSRTQTLILKFQMWAGRKISLKELDVKWRRRGVCFQSQCPQRVCHQAK